MFKSAEQFFAQYMKSYLAENRAASLMADSLARCGVGFMPLVDHCTLRTLNIDRRSLQVLQFGYQYDESIGVLEFDTWWAKVYRKPGLPALFIDQAYDGDRGWGSLIPKWVAAHGDQCFHHVAVLVEDIEAAIEKVKGQGVEFVGDIVGEKGTDLRQIFTSP
ncbi:MAG: VOC family protein [Nitrospinota bacterium]|nr:VOC family protein [Nitrospinota bacterium]